MSITEDDSMPYSEREKYENYRAGFRDGAKGLFERPALTTKCPTYLQGHKDGYTAYQSALKAYCEATGFDAPKYHSDERVAWIKRRAEALAALEEDAKQHADHDHHTDLT